MTQIEVIDVIVVRFQFIRGAFMYINRDLLKVIYY